MTSIFISYRRSDTAYIAGRLYDHLANRFGQDRVFRDTRTLRPGADFVATIDSAVDNCDAFLVLIGDDWLEQDGSSSRRIDDPNDWVRLEVAAALARDEVLVIPVCVESARMPPESELPDPLKPLARRHGMDLSDRNWDFELQRLIEALEEVVEVTPPTAEVSPRADPASLLPEYEIGGQLGSGGFGVVLSGRHRHLDREVAIKELPASLATDPKVRARFAAEARVLGSLSHPHIVPVYDFVDRHGLCLLVMEKLPGGTVWSHFTERGFTPETACAVAMATCAGLHYAHQRHVLHRDVKPENLLFSSDQVLKITDFGIAKVVGGAETLASRTGAILGTPAYIAPEQAEGTILGPPADIYSTGVMFYELLSGRLPYSKEGGALATVYRHVYEDAVPLREVAPTIPAGLADTIMRALSRTPEARYQTAEDFGVAIGESTTEAWGPNWLERSEVKVLDQGRIAESLKLASEGTARGSTLPSPARPPDARVRPQDESHEAGAAAVDLAQTDLVPVRQVIELPPPPLVQIAAAVLLAVLALVAAFVGIGSPPRSAGLAPGAVTIDGVDPAAGPVELDLGKPVDVRIGASPVAPPPSAVQLGFSVAGFPLPSSTTAPLVASGDGTAGAVEAGTTRFLIGGEATGELRLLDGETVVLRHEFPVDTRQPGLLSLPGVLVVALLLFLAAYVESLLRPLRRGRRRPANVVGLVIVGGALGATTVGLAWVLGGPEPTIVTGVVCGVLGAAAGGAAALAALQTGRRVRIRPELRAAAKASSG